MKTKKNKSILKIFKLIYMKETKCKLFLNLIQNFVIHFPFKEKNYLSIQNKKNCIWKPTWICCPTGLQIPGNYGINKSHGRSFLFCHLVKNYFLCNIFFHNQFINVSFSVFHRSSFFFSWNLSPSIMIFIGWYVTLT